MKQAWQSSSDRASLTLLAAWLLSAAVSCGKAPEAGSSYQPPPAVTVAETPSITGRVVLTGGLPSRAGKKLDVAGNPFCTGHGDLMDPAWKVSPEGGLADVVITVKSGQRAANVPDFAGLVDQKNCEFAPHVTVIQAGQGLRLRNSDLTFHNIRIARHELGTRDRGVNLDNLAQAARGDENSKVFHEPGIYRLECDVHRWMRAWVLVHAGAHTAVTDASGDFTVTRALPDGDHVVEAWHPMFPEKLTSTVTIRDGRAEASFNFDLAQSFEPPADR
ncbi:MAG TPA: carboxypeptidase regulatory-like domain-containing protein [Prosthecobacter sp.]|nr:carboxypeptidase regulatory-like domain-containing protein [Prosthecobacter sp.]HRK14293.1 carboxypeptidase regulatory-like domain-containing protein [Prosthecobacter sp.]